MARKKAENTVKKTRVRKTTAERYAEIIAFIRQHMEEFGFPPSQAQIARHLNVNQSTADHHMMRMASLKIIEMHPGMQRGIRLLHEGAPVVSMSELEEESSGENNMRRIETVQQLFGVKPDLFVHIDTEKLAELDLRPGDRVAIAKDHEPQEGDLVWTKRDGRVEVRPHRETKPAGQGEAIGTTIGVIRRT